MLFKTWGFEYGQPIPPMAVQQFIAPLKYPDFYQNYTQFNTAII